MALHLLEPAEPKDHAVFCFSTPFFVCAHTSAYDPSCCGALKHSTGCQMLPASSSRHWCLCTEQSPDLHPPTVLPLTSANLRFHRFSWVSEPLGSNTNRYKITLLNLHIQCTSMVELPSHSIDSQLLMPLLQILFLFALYLCTGLLFSMFLSKCET